MTPTLRELFEIIDAHNALSPLAKRYIDECRAADLQTVNGYEAWVVREVADFYHATALEQPRAVAAAMRIEADELERGEVGAY